LQHHHSSATARENQAATCFPTDFSGQIRRQPPSDYGLDDEQRAMLEELRIPPEKLYPDEFRRYVDLFHKYLPKRPFHHRFRYGEGFVCAKGKYKKTGEKYDRTCCPALVGKHLDYWRWKQRRDEKDCPPNYWIAMLPGKKSALKTIDFDNKQNLLGYYSDVTHAPRPLPTLSLEHLQAVKRLYDAFPRRIWCVSSATLGLHLWQRMPFPMAVEAIQATDHPTLKEIGLAGTEIHPMHGRCFRRPFGQDYFTITDHGLLESWIEQLDYFEQTAEPPTFNAVYQALRSLLVKEWEGYQATGKMEKVGLTGGKPHLLKYHRGNEVFSTKQLEDDLDLLDTWADRGFPRRLATSEAVLSDLCPVDSPRHQHPVADRLQDTSRYEKPGAGCDIDLAAVCDGRWVQTCEKWARNGLPCADSVFTVVSHLSRWFFFVEWWEMPEDMRLEKVVSLLSEFVLAKNNGFVSRLSAGHEQDVVEQVRRTVPCAVSKVDDSGKWQFMRVRQKRRQGRYKRVIFLEPVIRGKARQDVKTDLKEITPSPPVGLNICWSDLENTTNASDRRTKAEEWKFVPDDTPLPDDLKVAIEKAYRESGKRLYKPTIRKITSLVNYLRSKGGEARLGVKALAKMGFPDGDQRRHLGMLADAGIVRKVKGYSPVLAQGLRYRLTKRTMTMFGTVRKEVRSA